MSILRRSSGLSSPTPTPAPAADGDRFAADSAAVAQALLRAYESGSDVGEFLFEAVTEAQRRLEPWCLLTDNRPGSWEAGLLYGFVEPALIRLESERRP